MKENHCPECGALLDDPNDHSDPMRRRFFAIVRDVWQTLPDELAARYPSSEHLRKAGLVAVGWCDSRMIACGSNAAALEVANAAQWLDRYAVVLIEKTVCNIFTARSLRKRVCPKATFSDVAKKHYEWMSQLVGSDVEAMAA